MKLKVIGSSSAGNCYLLIGETETLIIEAGVRFKDIKKALNFDLTKIVGCIVSHQHGDHAKSVKEIVSAGIYVLADESVFALHNLTDNIFTRPVGLIDHVNEDTGEVTTIRKGYALGSFKISPFNLQHDVPCLGYVIQHPELGRLAFITDTVIAPKLSNINHWLIEANYQDEIINYNVDNGNLGKGQRDRVMLSHMSITTATDYLKSNDLTNSKNIILIHLSDGNSHANNFQKNIMEATGISCYIADSNCELTLNTNEIPFA